MCTIPRINIAASLEAIEGSLRGEVASVKGYNDLLEQERNVLRLQVASLESTVAEKDHELSDLEISSSSLRSQNQGLVSQVHELETSSARLREQLDLYEENMKRLEEFQDNLMRPLETRLAEIDADFTRCCMRFQESFHPHLLNVVAGRRWLLTHGMKLLMAKCLNSTEYMEALGNAFGRAIEKGMQEGLAAGIEHGQAGRCLTDLEAYIPSAEVDFNSAVCDLRGLNFPLLQELSNKKDASTWDVMDLLRLDDAVAEALGMTDLQPDVNQLMVPVHHKQDRVVIGSQALSVALDICRGRVEKMERNLVERLPFLKDVFVSLDHPLSAEALIEPPVVVPATNALSTVVIVPHSGPSVSVEDYENPDLVDVVPKNVTLGPEGEENIDASTGGDLAFSKLDDEARDIKEGGKNSGKIVDCLVRSWYRVAKREKKEKNVKRIRLDDYNISCYTGFVSSAALSFPAGSSRASQEDRVVIRDVFVSLDHPLSAEASIEPPVVTNALSTVVIIPHSDPSVSVEDYENPDLVDVVRGSSLPLQSFNLYGPSHLGPNFPVSSTRLASLLR
ncbi:hypothetical protein Tco_0525342, partial [Tanacetum coccineum]